VVVVDSLKSKGLGLDLVDVFTQARLILSRNKNCRIFWWDV
jgi:hypothetical protein